MPTSERHTRLCLEKMEPDLIQATASEAVYDSYGDMTERYLGRVIISTVDRLRDLSNRNLTQYESVDSDGNPVYLIALYNFMDGRNYTFRSESEIGRRRTRRFSSPEEALDFLLGSMVRAREEGLTGTLSL